MKSIVGTSFLFLSGILLGSGYEFDPRTKRAIQSHVKSFAPVNSVVPLCTQNTCCNITQTQSCPISSMTRDKSVLVLPGGNTRCIFSYSTPYAFQVIPGDNDKVLFYFQGGGACWDEASTKGGFCSSDVSPQSPVGIFDRTNVDNAYRNHTIVHALYCSGDVHIGNTTRPYNDDAGVPVQQEGLANVQSIVNWVQAQMTSGALKSPLTEFTVMGCSAGSLGAQLWGMQLVETMKWNTAGVVPDSYAGIFPPGSVGPLVYGFGYCTADWLTPDIKASCLSQTLTVEQLGLSAMAGTPSVPYSFIQSKTDAVQISFYDAVAVSVNASSKTISPEEFYAAVNELFGTYNQERANFVTYLVDGSQHCYTPLQLYYTADTVSSQDNGATTTDPMMTTWVNGTPLQNGESINTYCYGPVEAKGKKSALRGMAAGNNTDYCSSQVVPKTYTEQY